MFAFRSHRPSRLARIFGLGAAVVLAASALAAPHPARASASDYLTLAAYPSPTPVAGVPYTIELYASTSNGDPDECFTDHVILIYSDTSTTGSSGHTFSDGIACSPLTGALGGDLGEYWFEITPYASGPQTITAYDVDHPAVASATFNYTVAPGPAASITLSSLPANVVQNAGTPMTVTAHDAEGNVATGYAGTVRFTSTDTNASVGGSSMPYGYLFTAGDAGSARFVVKFGTTGSQSVTATDSVNSSVTATASTKVKSDDHFDIQVGNQEAGYYATCIVTAETETGSTDTGYTGTVLFTTSDLNPNTVLPSNGSTPDQVTFTAGMDGVFVCYEFDLMFYTAGVQTLTATDTTYGFTGSGSAIIFGGDTASVSLGGLPSTVFAGPVQVTVRAYDAYGNWGSDGELTFTSSDPLAVLPQEFSFHPSDYGTRQFTVTFETPGTQWLKVSGSEAKTTLQATISTTVLAGAATHLVVSGVASPYLAGAWGSVTVTAADAYGNTDPRYHGTVHFISSDPSASVVLPADYTFIPADAGSHTFGTHICGVPPLSHPCPGLVLETQGSQSVTATDKATSSITGSQSGILVEPRLVRYGGPDLFATAAAVSSNTFPANCGCTAWIAYGYNFPDALAGAAAAAAGTLKGPILFVATTGTINPYTAAELTRLKPAHIIVLGGTGVISTAVFLALQTYAPGATVRWAGADRFQTAELVALNTSGSPCGCTAYIATAYNFPDALAGAAAAGTVNGPVLLVSATGAINGYTKTALQTLKPTNIVVLGGPGVVSAAVYNALKAYAPAGKIARYYGSNRYATAEQISLNTFPAGCGCSVYIASGNDFNGALAAAAAAGTIKGPLLLVSTTGALPAATVTELTRLQPVQIIVVGNTSVVSAAVYNLLAGYLS